jgi:hypothetical protein
VFQRDPPRGRSEAPGEQVGGIVKCLQALAGRVHPTSAQIGRDLQRGNISGDLTLEHFE